LGIGFCIAAVAIYYNLSTVVFKENKHRPQEYAASSFIFFFKKGGRPKPNLHMNDMIHAGISYLHRVPGRAFDILVGSVWHNCCWLKKQLI
jgi:hypothetical protein